MMIGEGRKVVYVMDMMGLVMSTSMDRVGGVRMER
ncbi:hypothetical protein HRbin04_01150 [archaeon HR04]|nr:hypothetical protein HRbin04_01150 [archaeon HR04]